jgi:assimilatory nitrate reductase catalytic subunit
MLGWWSDAREPAVDSAWISAAFAAPPSDAARRHALLSGRPAPPPRRRGGSSAAALGWGTGDRRGHRQRLRQRRGAGAKLKCGTNCGSCVPELNALLATQRTRA